MRTSSRTRCSCRRMPSSFHSTDDMPQASIASATDADVAASIGSTGRSGRRPMAASPSAPSVNATTAARVRSPPSMAARRTAAGGHVCGLGHRVGHHAGQRTLPQLAGEHAAQEVRLVGGGALEHIGEQRRSAPRSSPHRRSPRSWSTSASMSRMVSDGDGGGGTSTLTTVRHPTPMRPWRGAAGEHRHRDLYLVVVERERAGPRARRSWRSAPMST